VVDFPSTCDRHLSTAIILTHQKPPKNITSPRLPTSNSAIDRSYSFFFSSNYIGGPGFDLYFFFFLLSRTAAQGGIN
jgi:hypothetical protein